MVVIHTTELLEGLSEGEGDGKIEENRTFMFFVKTRKTSYGFIENSLCGSKQGI